MSLDRALRGQDITTGDALKDDKKPKMLGDALGRYQRNRGECDFNVNICYGKIST